VGSYFLTVVTTVALLLALVGLRAPRRWIAARAHSRETAVIRLSRGAESAEVVRALNELPGISIRSLSVRDEGDDCTITADVAGPTGTELEELLAPLADRDDVDSLDVS
jgi:uncharacterized membrane protein YhiD involved in acid resistance